MSKRGGRGGGRGGKKSHKGRNRQFNNPEEMERQLKEERDNWREPKKDGEEEDQPAAARPQVGDLPPSDSDSEESSSDEEDSGKPKGVSHLIEIQNPNRVVSKSKKATQVDVNQSGTQALTRREREQIEKEQAKQRYLKLHQEGKTTEAQGDLARLALIRKQREEAAKKRDSERKAKEAEAAAKSKKK
ncbi:uncharacterized protein [Amphiura filiformis]|uniref:uncharacterized protein n=1 Tax=Amphiura filiformis TaxID=82378 RepID=UPI003B212204